MDKIRVILIPSVQLEPTSAGQIIQNRHLVVQPGIEWEVYGGELSEALRKSGLERRVLSLEGDLKSISDAVEALLKSEEQYQSWAKKIQQLSANFFRHW